MAKVSLYIEDLPVKTESGKIIFSDSGISGIPVMNISRYAVRAIEEGRKCFLRLDFFEDESPTVLSVLLNNMVRERSIPLKLALTGILNHKLLDVVLSLCGEYDTVCSGRDMDMSAIVSHLKGFEIGITGSAGWENAQVTTGGLSLDEIDPDTMESCFCDGLYIVGETLDVDGCCGGYNLQWAWSTGAIAGEYASTSSLK